MAYVVHQYLLKQTLHVRITNGDVMKRELKLLIATFLIILIFILSIVSFRLINDNNGLTAMEGKSIADNIAQDWNTSAELVTIHSIGGADNSGMCLEWRYTYANFNGSANASRALDVIVSQNGSWTINERARPPTPHRLTNWTYDSDQIVTLAKKESEIQQYLNKFPNAKIESMALSSGLNEQHTWYILWSDPGFMDDPHSAVIKLDANTGAVLYVDVQL